MYVKRVLLSRKIQAIKKSVYSGVAIWDLRSKGSRWALRSKSEKRKGK